MPDRSQYKFITTELDLDLLTTPYKVHTNWHVITGAPSSGKSTLIDLLANRGFHTVPESARLYIKGEMAKGREIHPIRTNPTTLQRSVKDLQLRVEAGLGTNEVLFLDGAVPSSLAYYRVFGMDPNEILSDCFHHRYASIFMLAPLSFQPDEERVEEVVAIAGFLDEWHTRDYNALGYNIMRVPVIPPEERLAFVLERLSEHRLN